MFAAAALFILKALLTTVVSLALGIAIGYLLWEDPDSPGVGTLEDFALPTSTQGRAIPVVFGSPRMKGLNDLWHGNLRTEKIEEWASKLYNKKQTIGYKYFLGFHFGWCASAEELLELRMEEQILWKKGTESTGTFVYYGEVNGRPAHRRYSYYTVTRGRGPVKTWKVYTLSYNASPARWQVVSSGQYVTTTTLYTNPSTAMTAPETGWTGSTSFQLDVYGATDPINAFEGTAIYSITSNTPLILYKPDMFGGKKSHGGVSGQFDIMFGGSTQAANPYLVSQLGSLVPAYRGLVSIVSNQCYIGNTTGLKMMDAIWRRTTKDNRQGAIWYSAKAEIIQEANHGSMNIAHVIHELIEDPEYSLGMIGSCDNDNFVEVADILYDEGFGISMVLDVAANGKAKLDELAALANGFVRVNHRTNKFQIKLLRDDFLISDLDIIDSSIISEVKSLSRNSASEIFNQVSITFTDPSTREPATLIAQNTALIAATGVIANKDMRVLEIHSPAMANKVATTALRTLGVNTFSAAITGKRELADYSIGDAIRLQLPEEGLADVVVRVLDVDSGRLSEGIVELLVTQDVFKSSSAVFAPPRRSQWTFDSLVPIDLDEVVVIEMPYYTLARDIHGASAASLLTAETGRPMVVGASNVGTNTNYELWAKLSTDTDYVSEALDVSFVPVCTLGTAIIGTTVTSFTVAYSDAVRLDDVEVDGTSWCMIDSEIFKIIEIDQTFAELTLAAGCLDTVPAAHAIGARIYFSSTAYSATSSEYLNGKTVNTKLLPSTTVAELAIDDSSVTTHSLTIANRYLLPINGAFFRGLSNGQNINFSWLNRNRLLQINTIVEQTGLSQALEAGVTYTFTAKNNGSTVRTVTLIAGSSYSYAEADLITNFGSVANAKLATASYHLKAVRGSYSSWQEWTILGTSI